MPSETLSAKSARFAKILALLKKTYPGAKCSLDYKTPVQLLVATILSAQCTDARVNKTTPALFAKCKYARDFAEISQPELESLIRSCGFYRNKAKNIRAACKIISGQYGGEIPRTMEEMLLLPGVARKTANIVLGNIYGVLEGIPVDTHAIRLSGRLALSREHDPNKIERDLMQIVPHDDWLSISNMFVHHGRALCTARNPKCEECPLLPHCPFGKKTILAEKRKRLFT